MPSNEVMLAPTVSWRPDAARSPSRMAREASSSTMGRTSVGWAPDATRSRASSTMASNDFFSRSIGAVGGAAPRFDAGGWCFLWLFSLRGSLARQRSKISRSVRMMPSCLRSVRVGFVGEQGLESVPHGSAEEDREPKRGEIAVVDLELALLVVEEPVVDAHGAQQPPGADRGARREVPRREELRVRSLGGAELLVEHAEERRERVAHLVRHVHGLGRGLQHVEVLDGERLREPGHADAADPAPEHRRQVAFGGEPLGHEAHEGHAVDEREERLARSLEHLGEVAVGRHQRALDGAARGLRALLQLALLEHVERRAEQHVAPVEHLVEERVHRAEHAFVREVLGAPGLHQRLEVDRADEIRLNRALGELPREQARQARAFVHHVGSTAEAMPLFAVPGGPVISTCSRDKRPRQI